MKKQKWLLVSLLLCAAIGIGVGVASAYLTDVEVADNVITIGRISVELDEGEVFTPTDPTAPTEPVDVVPGSKVVKAPKLTNSGNKDEYVFLKVTVPKADVTLLYEEDDTSVDPAHLKGTPRATKQTQEIFRFLADDRTVSGTSVLPVKVLEAEPSPPYDVDFAYHGIPDGLDGWRLLEYDLSGASEDVYYFGYNKKLAPAAETVTLFDEVQLKSFIDGELPGMVEGHDDNNEVIMVPNTLAISVTAYAIQADNLRGDTLSSLTGDVLDETQHQAVWSIVKNKAGTP